MSASRKRSRSATQSSAATPATPLATRQSTKNEFEDTTSSTDTLALSPAPSKPVLEAAAADISSAPYQLSILQSKLIAPDSAGVGIRCMAASHSDELLLIARESGSLTMYRLNLHQNTPHWLPIRHHGGRYHRTIQRAAFTEEDDAVVLAYLSGQVVVVCASTLLPLSVMQRSGGTIYDMALRGPFVVTAAADGTWRTMFYSAETRAVDHLQTFPKIMGSERALCVAIAPDLSMVVGGDDGGNVVAWTYAPMQKITRNNNNNTNLRLADVERVPYAQLWTSRIAKGFPMTLAVVTSTLVGGDGSTFTPCVAVGSSIGDVLLLDVASGASMRRFSHHKGPVSTVVAANEMFYASGWHESLRSYRCNTSTIDKDEAATGEWYPSEVKRRTHYHEASQLLVLPHRSPLLLSASKDGTLMYSPVATAFSAAAHYLDTTPQQLAFASQREALVQSRGNSIEAFRMSATRSHWVPLFSLALHQDKFGLAGLWCDPSLNLLITATDVRIQIISIDWNESNSSTASAASSSATPRRVQCLESRECIGTTACAFDTASGSAYVLTALELLQVSVSRGAGADATTNTPAASQPSVTIVSTPLTAVFHFVYVADETLFLAGPTGCIAFPLLAGGFVDTTSEPRVVIAGAAVDSVHGGIALVRGKGFVPLVASSNKSNALPPSLPHDAVFLEGAAVINNEDAATTTTTTAADPSALRVAYFSKGLLVADHKSWTLTHRLHCIRAFALKDGTVLALERNVEAAVEGLPLCWKVRRFGN